MVLTNGIKCVAHGPCMQTILLQALVPMITNVQEEKAEQNVTFLKYVPYQILILDLTAQRPEFPLARRRKKTVALALSGAS